ncbi:MAG: PQQ-like beta-propeller repeat protein [Phycisphaerae bacterium]|nr:PQQ-binding-like beta-propeller repeat protein [Phycisphaerae bacterium]NUQ45660.1 PQQ-like beta-propeller repeat protein [Phycisphaerae bacterium]
MHPQSMELACARPALPFALFIVASLMTPAAAWALDWPNFRGPNHDGISPEKGLAKPRTQPPPQLWEQKIGDAFSGMSCVGDRLYTCGSEDGQQVLLCLNAETGKPIWKKPFEKLFKDPQGGDGTRATPTIHEGRVYIFGGHGLLLCVDADTGSEVWKKQFNHKPQWGYSGSVLIEGDLAIVSAGESDGALAAFDKKTGEQKWKCGDDPVGYATPYPFTHKGRRYIAGFCGVSAIIADAQTGKQVWRMPWKTDWNVNASSPIYHDGHLFFSSGYRHGCIVLKLGGTPDKLTHETIWESRALRNKFQSCILYEGHLYTSDETALKCVEFLTGREKWSVPRAKHGTVVLADANLLFLSEDGKLEIAPATPKEFKPVCSAPILDGRCWTVSTLHRGRLYARNLERLVCVNLKG